MPTHYSLAIIHPSFELLKRSSRILHFIAASIIMLNGIHHFQIHHYSKVICYCQLLLAGDIYLLVLLGGVLLSSPTSVNILFRLIELLTFMGIGLVLVTDGHTVLGEVHFSISVAYGFLFYREYRIMHSEAVDIRQTGITIPNFLADDEISWQDIISVTPNYHSIFIETCRQKKIQFKLRTNLKIEELQQIDEFCKKHQCKT